MPVVTLRSKLVPPSLRGAIACGRHHLPHFWLRFWLENFRANLADGTNRKAIAAVDRLYATAAALSIDFDAAVARADVAALKVVLGAHLQRLNNRARQQNITASKTWKHCLSFIRQTLEQIGIAGDIAWEEIQAALQQLAQTLKLKGFKAKEPAPIRALPSILVMELYEIFDPLGPRNPFRTARGRFRNYLIFLILLHLGLRRGEILLLGVDAFQSEFDPKAGREVCWLIIDYVEADEDDENSPDPRFDAPSLKNANARRMLPISVDLFMAKEAYLAGYRAQTRWPHLFTSHKGRPLSPRRLNEIFEVATAHLSSVAKAALAARGKKSVEPHDLRHTAAVRRLVSYREGGISHSESVEKLRAFFGWHEDSPMPSRYARAYYERNTIRFGRTATTALSTPSAVSRSDGDRAAGNIRSRGDCRCTAVSSITCIAEVLEVLGRFRGVHANDLKLRHLLTDRDPG